MPDDPSRDKRLRDLGLFGLILGEVVGLSLAGMGLGYALSRYIRAPEFLMPLLGLGGLALAMYRISKMRRSE